MIQGSELALLKDWQNFYVILGAASATLTGLMFVAVSLVVGAERSASILDAGISAFNTPTVVHFCAVLLVAAILSAPWQAFSSVSLVLGLSGLSVVFYLVVVMRRMSRMPNYRTPLKDWLWYLVFPSAAYMVLIVAALVLPAHPAPALYFIAAAMVALLFLGLHNAWDLVIYFAVVRSQSDKARQK